MRGRIDRLLVVLIFSAAAVAGTAPASHGRAAAKLDPGVFTSPSRRAIVGFEHDVNTRTIRRLSAVGIKRAFVFDAIDAAVVRGPRDVYRKLARWSDVRYVEDDSPIEYDNYEARTTTGVDLVRQGEPPLATGYDGSGLTVAVVDSGINNLHPDLVLSVPTNVNYEPGPALDDISDGVYTEHLAEAPAGSDELGHGTHVAGTVAGDGIVGQGADMTGVAPGAQILNCKLGLSRAAEWTAIACYQWILDHKDEARFGPHGIRVATNSWHLLDHERSAGRPFEDMLRAVVARGVTVLFAAGNDGPDPGSALDFEVAMEEVITVGAGCKASGSDPAYCAPLDVATFSGRGEQVDVIAPGVGIWSTKTPGVFPALGIVFAQGNTTVPGQPDPVATTNNQVWYTPAAGTSMATPHVAGIVALMIEANPALTPAQVREILTTTARDRGEPGFDPDSGWGHVDAHAAVNAAEDA